MAHPKKTGIRDSWKDYFSFNNRVRRGLIVLFVLISVEAGALVYLHYLPTTTGAIDIQKFKREIDGFYASGMHRDSAAIAGAGSSPSAGQVFPGGAQTQREPFTKPELFNFNPNHLPAAEWKRLGFSDKQVRSIHHYEAKGGSFRTKRDVKKMYAINDREYSRIEPYIALPDSVQSKFRKADSGAMKQYLVDIGIAGQTDFEKLPLIGEYLAEKICNYREKLGGFYSVEQIKEVRGMRDSTFMAILPHLILKDAANLRRINLNTAAQAELNKHPYIDYALAGLIINYRKQHGAFREVEDLRKVALVDGELYRKIAPYLKAE